MKQVIWILLGKTWGGERIFKDTGKRGKPGGRAVQPPDSCSMCDRSVSETVRRGTRKSELEGPGTSGVEKLSRQPIRRPCLINDAPTPRGRRCNLTRRAESVLHNTEVIIWALSGAGPEGRAGCGRFILEVIIRLRR